MGKSARRAESRIGSIAVRHLKIEAIEPALDRFALHMHARNSKRKLDELTQEQTDAMASKYFARHAAKHPDEAAPAPTVDEIAKASGLSWK